MGRVIPHVEGTMDEICDPLGRPDLASIAVRLSPWSEQAGGLCHLGFGQLGGLAGYSLASQRLHASLAHAAHPLAHRAFGHPKRSGNVLLFPTQLLQFPGTPSPSFSPFEPCFLLVHAVLSHLFTRDCQGVERCKGADQSRHGSGLG